MEQPCTHTKAEKRLVVHSCDYCLQRYILLQRPLLLILNIGRVRITITFKITTRKTQLRDSPFARIISLSFATHVQSRCESIFHYTGPRWCTDSRGSSTGMSLLCVYVLTCNFEDQSAVVRLISIHVAFGLKSVAAVLLQPEGISLSSPGRTIPSYN